MTPFKVPKCEIFDRSDFDDFYTIKSLCEGDFGVKIKNFIKIFGGSFRGAKFLTRMLSLFWRRFFFKFGPKNFFSIELLIPLVSVNNNFLKFFILNVLKKLLKIFTSFCVCSGLYAYAEHTRQELMRMLSICISFPIFQRTYVIEVPTNHAEHTRKELVCMLSIHVRKWCACWAYASVPYAYAQHARQKLNAA